jgi:TPR repeat protein
MLVASVKRGVWDMARGDLSLVMEAEMAARCGAADQLFNLGMLYAIGREVPQDFVAAHKWFNLAAMRGSLAAKARRAEIALEMSAAQIADAQRAARAWLLAD